MLGLLATRELLLESTWAVSRRENGHCVNVRRNETMTDEELIPGAQVDGISATHRALRQTECTVGHALQRVPSTLNRTPAQEYEEKQSPRACIE